MKKIAIFPGSFDPITRGHESIILRAIPLFDEIIVAVGENAQKSSFFTMEKRLAWIQQVFAGNNKIKVGKYKGLTVDFCKKKKAHYIIRGLRNSPDFEFECSIGQMNKILVPTIETVFLLTIPEYTALNSSIVRDIFRNGGDISAFVPKGIKIK